MKTRQGIVLASLLLMSNAADAALDCPSGQKRLKENEPCIPDLLFNYLYCLNVSGGGTIEVKEGGGGTTSKTTEIQVKGSAAGVILKGGAEVGFKQGDVSSATRELQKKLDPNLASNCKSIADKITGSQRAAPVGSGSRTTAPRALKPPAQKGEQITFAIVDMLEPFQKTEHTTFFINGTYVGAIDLTNPDLRTSALMVTVPKSEHYTYTVAGESAMAGEHASTVRAFGTGTFQAGNGDVLEVAIRRAADGQKNELFLKRKP